MNMIIFSKVVKRPFCLCLLLVHEPVCAQLWTVFAWTNIRGVLLFFLLVREYLRRQSGLRRSVCKQLLMLTYLDVAGVCSRTNRGLRRRQVKPALALYAERVQSRI